MSISNTVLFFLSWMVTFFLVEGPRKSRVLLFSISVRSYVAYILNFIPYTRRVLPGKKCSPVGMFELRSVLYNILLRTKWCRSRPDLPSQEEALES